MKNDEKHDGAGLIGQPIPDVAETLPRLIIATVCGGRQAQQCRDGGLHDMSAFVHFKDGGSVACAKCGVTAMQIDLMELP